MPTDGAYSPPFDEQAALEELQRLRDAIQESRRQRSQRSDEFEAFVRSFRAPSPPPSPATDAVRRPQEKDRHPVPPPIEQRQAEEEPVALEQRESIEQATVAERPAAPDVAPSPPRSKRRARSLLPRALGGAAILVASLVLLIRPWKAVRSDTAASPSSGGAPTTTSAPTTG